MTDTDAETQERLEFIFTRFKNDAKNKGLALPSRERMILWTLNLEAKNGGATSTQIELAWQKVFGG